MFSIFSSIPGSLLTTKHNASEKKLFRCVDKFAFLMCGVRHACYDSGMNPLDKFIGSFLHKQAPQAVVGIDIGSAFIKAVQIHKKGGKAMLDTYGEIALGPMAGLDVGQATQLPAEKIAEIINDLFVEAKITSRDVVISLPLTSALLMVIQLPDLGEEKLKEMIPIEARKYIPTAVSEVSLNWWVIPKVDRTYVDPDEEDRRKKNGPTVDVLLAAVHNDVIERYKLIAQKIGAKTAAFEIEIFSTIRVSVGHNTSLTAVIDIGAGNTKVAIVEEGIIRSSHLINFGSQDITLGLARSRGVSMLDAEEVKRQFGLLGDPTDVTVGEVTRLAIDRIINEIRRIVMKYENEKHLTIGQIALTGGGSLLRGLPELVQSTFPSAKIELVHAFDQVEAPAILEGLLDEAGPEFATAIGLAFRKS